MAKSARRQTSDTAIATLSSFCRGARSPPTPRRVAGDASPATPPAKGLAPLRSPRLLADRGECLGGDHGDLGRAPQPERRGGRLDARRRREPSALDLKERVLSAQLRALGGQSLSLVARGRDGRREREVEEHQRERRADGDAHADERAHLGRRGLSPPPSAGSAPRPPPRLSVGAVRCAAPPHTPPPPPPPSRRAPRPPGRPAA